MNNKAIVKQFIDNLIKDNKKAFEVVGENVTANWPGSGMPAIKGHENLLNFFEQNGPEKVLKQTVHNLIEEDGTVIGDGTVESVHNGKNEKFHFVDVYKVKNGKINSLVSYMVPEKH